MEDIRAAWFAWAAGVRAYRRTVWRRCGLRVWGDTGEPLTPDDPEVHEADALDWQAIERRKCASDPAYFINVWCSVFENRGGFRRQKGWQPAIQYPFQVAYVRWRDFLLDLAEQNDERVTAADSKARTMGITWNLCLWDLHGWLFRDAFVAKLVSETAAKVDSGSLDSLFSRITSQFDWKRGRTVGNPLALPAFLLPRGFDRERDKVDMLLNNPENGNEINGEGTKSTTGRAGRATVGDVDEAAAIKGLRYLLGALSETLGLTILTSSESVKEDTYFVEYVQDLKKQHSPLLFEIDWWMHPLYTQNWLQATKASYASRNDLAAFEREILRRGEAGLSAYCYPEADQIVPGNYPYQPGAPAWGCLDPGVDDETALGLVSRDMVTGRYRVLAFYANRGQEPEFYASLIAGIEDERFAYGPPEWAIMAAFRQVTRLEAIYGDPYGSHRMTGLDTFYTKMTKWWDEHGCPLVPFVLNWKRKGPGAGRDLQERRLSLKGLLPRMDFHDDAQGQVRETVRALQTVKWDVSDRAAEQRAPRHAHEPTHRASSLEFFAVNRETIPLDEAADFAPYSAVA